MKESVFKAYDIRGIYPEEINEEVAERIGRAFVELTKAKKVLVGEDARVSTPKLRDALVRGVSWAGADVVLAGQVTTPMFYFGVAEMNIALRQGSGPVAGIMVTASHNPGKYNGFKMVRGNAMPIEPKELVPIITNYELHPPAGGTNYEKKGQIKKINVLDKYIEKLFSLVNASQIKELKMAIDAGNGMAGIILPQLLERIPQIMTEGLYFDTDMSFPNHEANPLKEETLKDLKKKVRDSGAHIGVAYDGDGDRVGFVDELGNVISADIAFCVILPELLEKYPGSAILYDLRCSKILPEEIKRLGGKPRMTRVGHAFIKKQLKEADGAGAAELSNHFYFRDFYGVECADLVVLYLLIEISKQNKPLSRIVEPFKKYYQSGEINFEVEDKSGKTKELKEKYKKSSSDFTDIDGIRIEFKVDSPSTSSRLGSRTTGQSQNDWWWFNVRPSNTEPLLRLNVEASDKKLLAEKVKELSKIIRK
ncbi:phosphomannomutase/phosphoglucomutase [Patescibacteria group bacterium]|nr:phosphomannomutase/phosphoglucomutase [Patescibacteria group bacterium]